MVKLSFITFTRNSAKRIVGLLENVKDVVTLTKLRSKEETERAKLIERKV